MAPADDRHSATARLILVGSIMVDVDGVALKERSLRAHLRKLVSSRAMGSGGGGAAARIIVQRLGSRLA